MHRARRRVRVHVCVYMPAFFGSEDICITQISLQIPDKQEVSEPVPFPFTVNQQPLSSHSKMMKITGYSTGT